MSAESPVEAARRAIVTGGSAGIGAAICRHLLDAGYEVINLSRRAATIDSPRLRSIAVDLADAEATQRIAREVAAESPATVIVHNAGATLENLVESVTMDELDTLTHLHLAAPLALVQANLAAMKSARFGRIVMIGSRATLGLQKRTSYAATKLAMVGFARTWAIELGPFGITANVVAPGPIETEMLDGLMGKDPERRQKLARTIPVRRLGTPDDVARAVTFFVAPEASFITGQTLLVCGGASIGTVAP